LSKVFRPPSLAFDEPSGPEFDYIEPPTPPDYSPTDPLLTSNFYGLPAGPGYSPQQTTTGANPGPSLPYAGSPSEVILPQMVPYAGISPGLIPPVSRTTTPPPIIVVTVPEPAEWPLLPGAALALLYAWRRKRAS
jgi:hypothetical protein